MRLFASNLSGYVSQTQVKVTHALPQESSLYPPAPFFFGAHAGPWPLPLPMGPWGCPSVFPYHTVIPTYCRLVTFPAVLRLWAGDGGGGLGRGWDAPAWAGPGHTATLRSPHKPREQASSLCAKTHNCWRFMWLKVLRVVSRPMFLLESLVHDLLWPVSSCSSLIFTSSGSKWLFKSLQV